MDTVSAFNELELGELRRHGFVLYNNRVIFDAQPPLSAQELADIQAKCAGPIPQELTDLWSITAGGSIAYDVYIELDGGTHSFSWTELFFNGAQTYFDLSGWIDRELEMLEESCLEQGKPFPGVLKLLPIGGFEYLDRVYVCVEPGDMYAHVAFWMQGLPAAWTHRLHNSSLGPAASNLTDCFALLHLQGDPRGPSTDYRSSDAFMEYLDERVESHNLDQLLADRLVTFYADAQVDWRKLLEKHSTTEVPNAVRAAIEEAIRTDDPNIINQLSGKGETFELAVSGTATAVDLAVLKGTHEVLRALLLHNARVPADVLNGIRSALPADLAEQLISQGARASLDAAAQAIAWGSPDAGRILIAASPGLKLTKKSNTAKTLSALEKELTVKLAEVRDGKLHHYLGEDGLELQIDRLKTFRL
jgi:hypothetical protein